MNILYITTSLNYPNGGCAKNVAIELDSRGHNITFLTQKYDKCEALDNNKFDIIHSNHCNLFSRIRRISNSFIKRIMFFIYRVYLLCMRIKWPLSSPFFAMKFAKDALKVCEEKNIDLVIAEYGDLACLIAGNYIKKRRTEVIYIPYFIDALFAGATPRGMNIDKKHQKALCWENKLISNADGIIMMEASKVCYENSTTQLPYFDKITYLDIPMFVMDNSVLKEEKRCFFDTNVNFLYTGALPRNIRNPQYLLELFTSVSKSNWHLYIVGTTDYEIELSNYMKKCNRIHFLGKRPHSEVYKMMQEADFLINIGNSLEYMVPSKIFEYISSRKPIISTSKISNDPCLKYLLNYGNFIVLDETNTIEESKPRVLEFINNTLSCKGKEDFFVKEELFYNNSPKAVGDYLEGINVKSGRN